MVKILLSSICILVFASRLEAQAGYNLPTGSSWKILTYTLPKDHFPPTNAKVKLLSGRFDVQKKASLLYGHDSANTLLQFSIEEDRIRAQNSLEIPSLTPVESITSADIDGDHLDEIIWIENNKFLMSFSPLSKLPPFEARQQWPLPDKTLQFYPHAMRWSCTPNHRGGLLLWKPWQGPLDMSTPPFIPNCLKIRNGVLEVVREFTPPPHYAALFPIDAFGDGEEEMVVFTMGRGVMYLQSSGNATANELKTWADFEPFNAFAYWTGRIAGDFNGDGRKDIVTYGNILTPARIALSYPEFALEQNLVWPLPRDANPDRLAVDDFDFDGRIDLAYFDRERGTLTFALNKSPKDSVRESRDEEATRFFNPFKGEVDKRLHHPKVCLGYLPTHSSNDGYLGKWDATNVSCPANYAFFSALEGDKLGPIHSVLRGQCCPLPSGDILTEQSLWTTSECPENHIVTGRKGNSDEEENSIRCTKINTDRYRLGPLTQGVYWGSGLSTRFQRKHVATASIPEAIRYGIRRLAYDVYAIDGCIGLPFGSLLSKKGAQRCYQFGFQQLLYRGANGDPSDGTPVTMFPDCASINNLGDGNSGCRLSPKTLSAAH